MQKKRSVGVIVFGTLCIIYPVLINVVFNIFIGNIDNLRPELIDFFTLSYYRLNSMSKAIIYTIFAFVLFIGGLGILTLKSWARMLLIQFSLLVFVIHLVWCISILLLPVIAPDYYGRNIYLETIFWLVLHFLIHTSFLISLFFYLTRPKVKRAFGERNPEHSEG